METAFQVNINVSTNDLIIWKRKKTICGNATHIYFRGIPLWNKGENTVKQPIWVGDVAAGITAIVKDPDTSGKTYQFVGSVNSIQLYHWNITKVYEYILLLSYNILQT